MEMNRHFTAICAALLMCAFLIVFYVSPKLAKSTVAFAENSDGKVIYLTFDDGPSDRVTPKILDVLKEEDVKATFFIVGKHAETRKYILKREFEEGHTIAIHSYSHNYSEIYSSPESLLADIDKCNKIIEEITGEPSSLYRFPGGSYGLSSSLINTISQHGYRYVDWNASTRDAEIYGATPDQLYKAAVTTPANSNYIVMLAHDTTTKSATADALKDIIRYYKKQGYTFRAF
ncbi:MAG: polysaccharide deacetylase [Clostridia bacterium]|nr:polysaccharide deacetylase [Clostridia bacterium]